MPTRPTVTAILLLLAALTSATRAAPPLLAPAGEPAVAGGEPAEFDLVTVNDTAEPIEYVPPAALAVRVRSADGSTRDASLDRLDPKGDRIPLDPGRFAKVRYRLTGVGLVPGRATVELPGGSAAAFDVLPPSAAPPARRVPPLSPERVVAPFTRQDPNFKTEAGLVEYLAYRIRPHGPAYFLPGDEDPAAKFQFSFKYQIFDPQGALARAAPPLRGLFFAYSQTSFWDIFGESKPFFDNSYRPSLLVQYEEIDDRLRTAQGGRVLPSWLRLDLQAGVEHESNGRGGENSRSLNVAFVRPTFTFGDRSDYFVSVGPRFNVYLDTAEDNPDIEEYRGYADLRLVAGQAGGAQLAATGRMGNDFERGSLQLDLSTPIRRVTGNSLDVYLHAQYFVGYGESLLLYDERTDSLRFGISIVR